MLVLLSLWEWWHLLGRYKIQEGLPCSGKQTEEGTKWRPQTCVGPMNSWKACPVWDLADSTKCSLPISMLQDYTLWKCTLFKRWIASILRGIIVIILIYSHLLCSSFIPSYLMRTIALVQSLTYPEPVSMQLNVLEKAHNHLDWSHLERMTLKLKWPLSGNHITCLRFTHPLTS